MVCAAKGYPLVVTMADSFSIERRQADAHVRRQGRAHAARREGLRHVQKARELAEANGWFLARQFETEANAEIHENTTAREIIADSRAGGSTMWSPATAPAGPSPASAACCERSGPETRIILERAGERAAGRQRHRAEARHGRRSRRKPPGLRAASDPGLDAGLHPDRAAGGHRQAAATTNSSRLQGRTASNGRGSSPSSEGILTGISGGATFAVAMQDRRARQNPARSSSCMLPDTGERYLSSPLFEKIAETMTKTRLRFPSRRRDTTCPPLDPARSSPASRWRARLV